MGAEDLRRVSEYQYVRLISPPPFPQRKCLSASLLSLLFLFSAPASASLPLPPEVIATRTSEAHLVLDGLALEDDWEQAGRLEGFTPFAPQTDVAPRYTVEGRVLRTERAIHLFFEVTLGHAPRAFLIPRDSPQIHDMDRIAIHLDPGGNARRGHVFLVGASGVLRDGLLDVNADHYGNHNPAWDSLFDARTHRTATGWSAEIRIPFQSLRFSKDTDAFGMHAQVFSFHHQQGLSWAPIDRDRNNWLTLAGQLRGLDNIRAGRELEILPSLTLSGRQIRKSPLCEHGGSGDDIRYEPGRLGLCNGALDHGLGIKWAISPSWTLDMALHPDFSQVEADARELVINNRFPLQLKERRPFFQEGLDLFELPFNMLYTRSINQPEIALKLTGSEGPQRVGLLLAYDSSPPDSISDPGFSPTENPEARVQGALTTAARTQLDLGSRGTLGMSVIDKEFLGVVDASNQVIGIDARAFLTPWIALDTSAFMSTSNDLNGLRDAGHATRARIVMKEDLWRLKTRYSRISEGFRSEAGYLPRRGYHNFFNKLDFFIRREGLVRVVSPGGYADLHFNDDMLLSERVVGANCYVQFDQHVFLFARYERQAERIDGRWIDGDELLLRIGANTWREFQFSTGIALGETILRSTDLIGEQEPHPGFRFAPSIRVDIRPVRSFTLTVEYQDQRLSTHREGDLLSDEPIFRVEALQFLTRDLHLRGIFEWAPCLDSRCDEAAADDPSGRALTSDLLLSYTPSPLSVFFLGYRERTLTDPGLRFIERSLFLKWSRFFSI